MSVIAIEATTLQPVEAKNDPYMYGWREIWDEYSQSYLRIPLTLYDALHPLEGDQRLHTSDHERFCGYLYDVCRRQVSHDPTAIVFHDLRIAWNHATIAPHTPDISVIFGVSRLERNWSTFYEFLEGTKPLVAMEVTSPETRKLDVVTKLKQYAQVGVEYYIIVDIVTTKRRPTRQLMGYELTPHGYVPLHPDKRGWLWLPPLKIWLAFNGTELACYDDAGQLIPDYSQVSQALVAAEAKVKVEAEARAQAEAQAQLETQARLMAEARLQELEAQLQEMRNKK